MTMVLWYFVPGVLLYMWFLMGYEYMLQLGKAERMDLKALLAFLFIHLAFWPLLIIWFIMRQIRNA